ncbi:MAG: hypothetical protein ACT4OP_05335 [Actinomycetota bacterium]
MARIMVVANQTADSPELASALVRTTAERPGSGFVLVVPLTPVQHLRGWTEGESRVAAEQAGERARVALERHGVKVEAVRVGDPDPVNAAADEWNAHPEYDEVILSTFPKGVSRWLKADPVKGLKRRLEIPVRHVVAEPRG